MRKIAFLLSVLFSSSLFAQTAYKCTVNKTVVYQFAPCDTGEKINIREETEDEKLQRETLKPPIEIGDLEIKKSAVKYNSLYYFAKVNVKNNTDNEFHAPITFLGIDHKGFAVERVHLLGKVPARSSRDFNSIEERIDITNFNKIHEWKLEGK